MSEPCLQETYAPHNACFGCGPANEKGLRIRSFVDGDRVVADWTPEAHHEAFPGVLNGGIIGALLDCHCNWTAAWHLMDSQDLDRPPCTVTMEYTIKLRRPTPTDRPLHLEARVVDSDGKVVTVEGQLFAGDRLCDHCIGKFVAVEPGHPAYHRW
ncbi:MAG: PaaI family thioesterase [Wenzhouxiangella sp.]|jgi:acyl-coenzyme A thioesterase PaaI-like protein|nr:PaaI family thioesterase [Wenzhouxiangella sp.]